MTFALYARTDAGLSFVDEFEDPDKAREVAAGIKRAVLVDEDKTPQVTHVQPSAEHPYAACRRTIGGPSDHPLSDSVLALEVVEQGIPFGLRAGDCASCCAVLGID